MNNEKIKYEPICIECGNPIKEDGERIKSSNNFYFTQKEVIGLNKKIFGDKADKFYCVQCLAKSLNFSIKKIRELIDRWTEIGCGLFK